MANKQPKILPGTYKGGKVLSVDSVTKNGEKLLRIELEATNRNGEKVVVPYEEKVEFKIDNLFIQFNLPGLSLGLNNVNFEVKNFKVDEKIVSKVVYIDEISQMNQLAQEEKSRK